MSQDAGTAEVQIQPTDEQKPDTGPVDDTAAKLTADVEKWKALARKHEAEAKTGKDAAKRLAEIEAASQTDLEKAVTAARRETEDAIRAEVRRERVLDRIEVLAAKDFADPEDARLRLGQRADEFVTSDGAVDTDAIAAALKTLLGDKPHLAAKEPSRFQPVDLGPRNNAPPTNPKAADLAQIEADLQAASRR